MDHTPLIPFAGMLLAGLAVGQAFFPDGVTRKYTIPNLRALRLVRALENIGRNSLAIYIVQEPISLAGAL